MAGGNAFYTASHALPCNSFYCLGHFKNVYDDDDDECFSAGTVRETVYRRRPGLPGRRTHHLEHLPDNAISAPSLSTFRRRLKTFLFQASFPDIITDPR